MKDSNNITLTYPVSDSFREITCSICGKRIGIVHVSKDHKNRSFQDYSCTDCSETFYDKKSIKCYLCGKSLQKNFKLVGEGVFKRNVCTDHHDAEHMVLEKENTEKFNSFVERCGKILNCSYCKEKFEINNYNDLTDARYVHKYIEAGIELFGEPFSCPKCLQLIKEKKIKYCIECGKKIKNGRFCSTKCNIAFCEN